MDAIVFPNIWGQDNLNAVLDACNCSEVKDMATDISNAISMQYLPFLQKKYEEVCIGKIEVDKLIGIIDAVTLDRKTEMNSKESLLDDEDTKNRIKEIQELEAVKYGHENIDKIRRLIKNCKSIDTIEKAIKLTNSKKLTIKSKELANELITEDYIKRFNDELGVLTRNSIHVKMEQQAGKGSNPFKIKLVDVMGDVVSPDDILSEGEKRIVALAAFFAESSGRVDNTPLIVDDPISSLDYLFEDAVIRRLADISRQRQVIVFTHRLSMLAGLDEQRKSYGVPFCEKRISGKGKIKGVPIDDVEFTGKADKQINHIMNIEVPKLRKTDLYSAEYIKQINYICQQIRIAVEKSVEDILLNGVVVRWRRGIQTLNKLGALANITLDDCKIIDDMMTKYSYYDHSMGDDTPLIDFSADEIQNDLDTFAHWIAEKKKSNNKK